MVKYRKKSLALLVIMLAIVFAGFDSLNEKEDKLREIAGRYKNFRQYTEPRLVVTDSANFSWTVGLCDASKNQDNLYAHYETDSSFVSNADETLSPHGNKLYKLYIKDYSAYVWEADKGQPIGQVIVKETWNVRELAQGASNENIVQIRSRNDGKLYTPTTVSEVFIMYKEKSNKSNDRGWNYGNVSIEDKNRSPLLFNNRKLSSCIRCHAHTKYDRVFGVK